MRRLLLVLSLLSLTACTAESSSPKPTPPPTTTPRSTTAPSTASALGCAPGGVHADPPPDWTNSANPPAGMRWVAGEKGNVVGMLFSDPLKSGETDKILWIVKQPRDGSPLQIRGTLSNLQAVVNFTPVPPDSGPGEIFPWTVAVPEPGCWRLALSWGAAQDVVAVPFT